LEIKNSELEIPIYEYGRLNEKLYETFFEKKLNMVEELKDCAVYLKELIQKSSQTTEKMSSRVDLNVDSQKVTILKNSKQYLPKLNNEADNLQYSKSPTMESNWKQINLELFHFIQKKLKANNYEKLKLAAEFRDIFTNSQAINLKNSKNISAFKRLCPRTLSQVKMEKIFNNFQGRLENYLFKINKFVQENQKLLLNEKYDYSIKIKKFHEVCKNSLICNKDYLEELFLKQKKLAKKMNSSTFSINEYQELLINSTLNSNKSSTPLQNILHINNIFGLSIDYINFDLCIKNPLLFIQNLINLIPKKISKPLISVPSNTFSIFVFKNKQRILLNKLILRIVEDLQNLKKYLKNETQTISNIHVSELLMNKIPIQWYELLHSNKTPKSFKNHKKKIMSLKGFLLHILMYHQHIFTSQKQVNTKMLNLKFCSDPFSLLPSLRHKLNKYHGRYIFPLIFSTTCFSPKQIQLYIENSKDSDEIGVLGLSIMESGFIRTEQRLIAYSRKFKNKWLSLLYPRKSDESSGNKKLEETKLKMISHQMNIIRIKMTQNIYSSSIEDKFVKEHPVEDIILNQLQNPSEEFCIPIYLYLTDGIKIKMGYTNVERGDKPMEYWLTSNVKIKHM
jgi:hypothetical protein